jgi:hypothetical protein
MLSSSLKAALWAKSSLKAEREAFAVSLKDALRARCLKGGGGCIGNQLPEGGCLKDSFKLSARRLKTALRAGSL